MIVTDRDNKVLDFISDYKVATTKTITELFYPSERVAQRRLKLLADNNLLKRDRDNYTSQFYYYNKKPRQLRHSLLVTDFYREFTKIAKIEMFKTEFIIEDVRADAFIAYEIAGKKDIAFLEVQIANSQLDLEKYAKLDKSGKLRKYRFPRFPLIISVTNKNIPKSYLRVVQVREDMSNLKEVMV